MKLLKIAWKDFTITYRDVTALLLMIVAPLAMTLVMAFAFSGSSDAGFTVIPVALVNQDDGLFGEMIQQALISDAVQSYLEVTEISNLEEAQDELDQDKVGGIIFIPKEASASLQFNADENISNYEDLSVDIDLFTNPVRPISGMIIESVLDSILVQINAGFAGGMMGFGDLLNMGLVPSDDLTNGLGEEIGRKIEPLFNDYQLQITIETNYWAEEEDEFNWMSYMAPSMAILYLGFSMTTSARSLLSEKENGTFGRLLASPTRTWVLITGKMLGTFVVGLIQVFIFIIASIPLLGIHWGAPATLILFTLVLVLASASWGIVIASLAKNSGQASALGMAVNLIFAAIAGNFVPRGNYPEWLLKVGYLTPNAWGIEGYLKLINGGNFSDIQTGVIVLFIMSAVLLTIASLSFALQYGQFAATGGSHE